MEGDTKMTKPLDPYVKKILRKYLPEDIDPMSAVWIHPQSDSYIVTHKALEIVAATAGILFDPPEIVQASAEAKICIIIATGRLGDRVEWSFGEATPQNNRMNYPYAMAEKRAKDRVILKLIGIHGYIYTDAEMEDAEVDSKNKKENRKDEIAGNSEPPTNKMYQDLVDSMNECDNEAEINASFHKNIKVWSRFEHEKPEKYKDLIDIGAKIRVGFEKKEGDAIMTCKDVAKERVSK